MNFKNYVKVYGILMLLMSIYQALKLFKIITSNVIVDGIISILVLISFIVYIVLVRNKRKE